MDGHFSIPIVIVFILITELFETFELEEYESPPVANELLPQVIFTRFHLMLFKIVTGQVMYYL
jgi:hypothetical protein